MHPKSLGRLERTDYWDPPAGISDSVGVGEREGWDFTFLTYSQWCWCWSREHTLSSTETGHKIRFFKILINEENLFYISLTEHVPGTVFYIALTEHVPGTMLNAIHILSYRQSEPHFEDEGSDVKDLHQGHTAKPCDKTKTRSQDCLTPKPRPWTTPHRDLLLRVSRKLKPTYLCRTSGQASGQILADSYIRSYLQSLCRRSHSHRSLCCIHQCLRKRKIILPSSMWWWPMFEYLRYVWVK